MDPNSASRSCTMFTKTLEGNRAPAHFGDSFGHWIMST
ncbi:hypothetical protein F443_22322 [Phytophthora nicotianae P1569]|uniref:Uncharacterized protein n=1 Tax=Phytophthora nicotianae P1569 TaxID=1317065 RepID=V9DUM8_PHYNI|nr:hypothetical protein F443_22322 [Phytophthora nicotianae P1569]